MTARLIPAAFLLSALGVAACDDTAADDALRPGSPAVEAACVAAVNARNGDTSGAIVTSSDYSEAGSLVMITDDDRVDWRCLAANDGSIEELTSL